MVFNLFSSNNSQSEYIQSLLTGQNPQLTNVGGQVLQQAHQVLNSIDQIAREHTYRPQAQQLEYQVNEIEIHRQPIEQWVVAIIEKIPSALELIECSITRENVRGSLPTVLQYGQTQQQISQLLTSAKYAHNPQQISEILAQVPRAVQLARAILQHIEATLNQVSKGSPQGQQGAYGSSANSWSQVPSAHGGLNWGTQGLSGQANNNWGQWNNQTFSGNWQGQGMSGIGLGHGAHSGHSSPIFGSQGNSYNQFRYSQNQHHHLNPFHRSHGHQSHLGSMAHSWSPRALGARHGSHGLFGRNEGSSWSPSGFFKHDHDYSHSPGRFGGYSPFSKY